MAGIFGCKDYTTLPNVSAQEIQNFSEAVGLTRLEELSRKSVWNSNYWEIRAGLVDRGMIGKVASYIQSHADWSAEAKIAVWRHFSGRFMKLNVSWEMSETKGANQSTIFYGASLYCLLITKEGKLYYGKISPDAFNDLEQSRRGTVDLLGRVFSGLGGFSEVQSSTN